ncbi:ABC transporter ATP-binding protein [Nocardioides sp. CER19]|uniref:ABC transporter ATP-binding protein n=1 Tax=Nocardioides sp. CER19 TaxID=3038538 RepID=UPI00244AF1E5|nr:ABC transporter ATP-binding protein [Nocardioides sp. CER19]MDH2416109.1 ABC transporter ATP-binding protein [Nocardioides sp. CER19]
MNLLEVDDLHVDLRTGDTMAPVLRGVSLRVSAGEAVGLVGESGCGKSMTTRAVMNLLPRGATTTGRVRFEGSDILAAERAVVRASRQRIGIVFQDPRAHINPVRRIEDFITEQARSQGHVRRMADRRALELLEDVGIEDPRRCMTRYPHQLSGGMLQRVMIAAALMVEPVLILADEPTTALDVTTQSEVMAILDELRRERGVALLFISHDLDLAMAVCDRISVMYAGQIVETRAAALLHDDPLHPYTAGLASARPSVAHTAGRLAAIPGRPLSALEAPEGCAFAPRCAHEKPACSEPQLLVALDEGEARCVRATELRGLLGSKRG